jgi:NADPH2:quinone reductase
VDVWYETQREPDFLKTFPLLKKRGRMVVMAGRQAQPIFPLGGFYPKDCSLFGFAMFNSTTDEQRVCATDINRWMKAGQLAAPIGQTFRLSDSASAHRYLEENTLGKAGSLTGKVVLKP